MIIDRLSRITGRIKDIKELFRLVNKGINTVVDGMCRVGKTFVLDRTFKAFCNSECRNKKYIYIKSLGTKRDYDQIIFVMSWKYNDIYDENCKDQIFTEFLKGNQQQIERRILIGIKNSDLPYVFFIEEKKKLPDTTRIFLEQLMKTGKVSIVAEPMKMSDLKTRQFYQGFDRQEVRPLNDDKMELLFDYLIEEYSVKIKPEDYQEIKSKLLAEVAGNPGRLEELIIRSLKEREVKKEDILSKYPSSYRNEYAINQCTMFLAALCIFYRYYSRGLGRVSDLILAGLIFAFGLLLFKISNKYK